MKGRELSIEEVKALKDGTKIWYKGRTFETLAYKIKDDIKNCKNDNLLFTYGYSGIVGRSFYEWIEEPEEKLYSNSEVMAMLEKNPELIFENDTHTLKFLDNKRFVKIRKDKDYISSFFFELGDKWRLVQQQPVKFEEAVKAFDDGKVIYCEYNSLTCVYDPIEQTLIDNNGGTITAKEILFGKWYIQDYE
ncbi:hypothetical protein [Rhodopseudomonas parapalustris]